MFQRKQTSLLEQAPEMAPWINLDVLIVIF